MLPLLTILLSVLSLWLMLPRGGARGRRMGIVLGVAALGLAGWQLPRVGAWLSDGVFWVLAAITIAAAVGAVTFRNPVYCVIWFGLSLLGTAGLFLAVGAQFLAVATVAVYAGAILVMFLFVLMLAQPEGTAPYDSVSWEALLSAATGVAMVGVLSVVIGGVFSTGRIVPPADPSLAAGVLVPQHVAAIGRELFARHWIALELTGVLLLVALVGAAVIVGARERRGGEGERGRGGDGAVIQ
jgi:NADH-quinone oxidoreductase subunit J